MSSCCFNWHLKISRRIYSDVFITSLVSIPRRSSRGNSFLRALPPRLCSPEKHSRKSGFSFSASIAPPLPFRRRRQTREDTRSGNISSSPSVEKYSLPSYISSHSTVSCKINQTWLEAAASAAGLRLRTTPRPSCWDTSQCRRS